MNCPNCSSQIPDNSTKCPECGSIINENQNQNESKTYSCEVCGEEIEYITAYRQWYCYNCQTYVDLPEPTTTQDTTEPIKPKPELSNEPEDDTESKPAISWDNEGAAIDEDKDETEAETELNWDDAVEPDEAGDIDVDEEIDTGETIEFKTEGTGEEPETEGTDEFIMAGPIAGVDPESDTIENLSADDIEVEIDEEYEPPEETIEILEHGGENDIGAREPELKKKALEKLHEAWLKVNNLKSLAPKDPRILQLEEDLNRVLEGDFDPRDSIVIADESIEEAEILEKELKGIIHQQVSDLFHFVGAKITLAKKIGFNLEVIEEELDNVTSLIARGEYHLAKEDLESLLEKIFDLPKTQDEIMIGLDPQSEIIQELLEPLSKE